MLFKLKQGEDIKELNNGIEILQEFKDITSKQLTVVALVADYDSPLRKLPERQRRERACILAGYPMEGTRVDKNGRNVVLGKVESIEKAIVVYKGLQYDEEKEILAAYDQQIADIIELMKREKPEDLKEAMALSEKAAKLSTQLPEIKEAKKKIQGLLADRGDYKPEIETFTSSDLDDVEEGDEELSTIDRVMQKQKNNAAN
jgi:hypothetical protein